MDPTGSDATAWLDRWWDDRAGMVLYPSTVGSPTNPYQRPGVHLVRESAAYAVALLSRGAPGDVVRAERALGNVLDHQIDEPRSVAHGTWRRAPGEPLPGASPREWIDYDPNWREFVGTAFALALAHDSELSPGCVARMEAALRKACEGTLVRGVSPEYTNIALMSAFLLDWTGDRLGEPAWREAGAALGNAVADAYETSGAFPEHNSPTYYGIDLYGVALWRARARSDRLRERGAALEAALWRDLARFYHAGLRNLCGPYTRAYGMDMTRYVATLGCWIAPLVPEGRAPLPPFGDGVPDAHDLFELPLVAALEARAPAEVAGELAAFAGPRTVEQRITDAPGRVATATLRESAMWGGEHASGRFVHWQHHPATIHWRAGEGRVGWARLVANAPVDVVADARGLDARVHTGLPGLREADLHVWLECSAPPRAGPDVVAGVLVFPGLELRCTSEPKRALEEEGGGSLAPYRVGFRLPAGTARPTMRLRLDVES